MFSVGSVQQLITELEEYCDVFDRLDKQVGAWLTPKRRELRFTDEMLQASLNEVLSGHDDPLPGKQAARELGKKLTRRQRLTRVWEFALDDGRRPLIFELADGSFWQLCDVGLGWTHYRTICRGWGEHPAVKPYLPAEILPRPEAANPWDYEFTLTKGAVLWVKPGRQQYTFRWGMRISAASTEQGPAPG